MGTIHRRIGVATAVVLIAALTACAPVAQTPSTTSEPTASPTPTVAADPDELLRQALDNMLDASSKRLTGTAAVDISAQEFEVIFVGDDAKGSKLERATEAPVESAVEFVKVDGSLYILADESYWQWYVGLQDLSLVSGHWVRVPADHPDHSALLILKDSDTIPWEAVGELTEEGDADDSTVVLVDTAGTRFTVSTDGIPYLVRVEVEQATENGVATADITFSDFDTITETITAPTGEIVELQ